MSTKYRAGSGPLDVLAAKQHGVLSRAQALAIGIPRTTIDDWVASGRWMKSYPGVYRLPGAPSTWRQALLASCLAWGEGATVSHWAAFRFWDLPGFERRVLELSVPRDRKRAHPHRVHRPRSLPQVDVTIVDAIPVTTPARTLIDVAATAEAEVLEDALDDGLRRKLFTIARMRWRLRELGPKAGAKTLGRLLDIREGLSDVPDSRFETRLLRVLRAAKLPLPEVQYRVGRYRVDFAYPAARVAIEADGFAHHSGRRAFESDRARHNALSAQGWTVMHVTWAQLLERPDDLIEQIRVTCSRSALRSRRRSSS